MLISDYLERDAHFTGAAYGHIDLDRLMRVLLVKNNRIVFKASGIRNWKLFGC